MSLQDWERNGWLQRHQTSGYDQAGLASDADASAVRTLAKRLKTDVVRWLQVHHPELLK
jgi:hypothetical protein